MPEFSELTPGSLAWSITVASAAHIVFNPTAPQRREIAKLIGKPFSENVFDIWNVADFTRYLQKAGGQSGGSTQIARLLAAMERVGLLLSAGWEKQYPLLGQRYVSQGTPSAQRQGTLWLSEVLGAELIIEAYKLVTIQISGGGDAPWGTGLVLDGSHVLTNKHVVMDLARKGYPLQIHAPLGVAKTENQTVVAFTAKNIDVAVLRVEPPNDGCFKPLPGLVFRDPSWADEIYLLGYPRVPWMVGSDITVQRGEVVNPLAEAPPVREKGSDPWDIPERTKIFLYSAIARPGNSGGPIIAHDGRVIGIVVEDSMATSSSDPDADVRQASSNRFPTSGKPMDTVNCRPSESTEQDADADHLPEVAPFYRGIPTNEIRRALQEIDNANSNLNLESIIVFEDARNP
jgi:S1-C subfamily serine protease